MAGLVPAIPLRKARLRQDDRDCREKRGNDEQGTVRRYRKSRGDFIIKIAPSRVCLRDQPCFPGPRPVLEILFALDGFNSRREDLEINQTTNVIALAMSVGATTLVLIHTPYKVSGYADVKRTTRATGQNVHVKLGHGRVSPVGIAGTSPAMTRRRVSALRSQQPRDPFGTQVEADETGHSHQQAKGAGAPCHIEQPIGVDQRCHGGERDGDR